MGYSVQKFVNFGECGRISGGCLPRRKKNGQAKMASAVQAPSTGVDRTLTILETLAASTEAMTLTVLAQKTRIPLTTCAAIMISLENRGYATRRIVGRSHFWRLTMGLYGLASQLVREIDLSSIAQQELRELAERIKCPVHIGVLNGQSVVYIAKAASPGFIQFDTYPGKVAPFNLTALGRAIAAYLPEEELSPLLGKLVPGAGPDPLPPGPEAFVQELEQTRKRGYAVENEEEEAGVSCLAAPFFNADGHVAGSVGATSLASELVGQSRKEIASELITLGREISHRLGFDSH